ncbi:MAG: ferric reductase-like transmembrane domain-containing protein [Solirubrobacterales bacterium]
MNVAHHLFWITSRAAGTTAILLASLSVTLGLMMTSGRRAESRRDLRTVHEWLSLATLALVGLHGTALLGDAYLSPGLSGIAVPFASAYRPLWTGIGIIAGYGLAALGLSYYARNRIGASRWKRLHRFTALFWAAAIAHTLGAGTDAGQVWFLALCGVLVVPAAALLALRLLSRAGARRSPPQAASRSRAAAAPGRPQHQPPLA